MPSTCPAETRPFRSLFDAVHDVVVVGAGYAAFAAATLLARPGRSVVLLNRQPGLLWESAWAFAPRAGDVAEAAWREWIGRLERHGAAAGGMIDGAAAEIIATRFLRECGVPVLYYATPMAAERGDGGLEGLIVGTKSGLRRLAARQWIDATETGELARLLFAHWRPPAPSRQVLSIHLQHSAWPADGPEAIACPQLPGARLLWQRTIWPRERRLVIDLPGDQERPRAAWLPALAALRETLGDGAAEAVVTHGSVVALPTYGDAPAVIAATEWPANVVLAVPGTSGGAVATPADRFRIGLAAAAALAAAARAHVSSAILSRAVDSPPAPLREAQVAVAGLGTGGLLAALAAARTGASVLALEPQPFVGGIPAGGGIHYYYYGIKGGLQEEVDQRTRAIMPLFGRSDQVQGFHPDARKLIAEQLLAEAGVEVCMDALLVDVTCVDGRVTSGLAGLPGGALCVRAQAWIDATGDGDLAAGAGARCLPGRRDGLVHAYSQSSGRVVEQGGKRCLRLSNYDAGFVDPSDVEDLTRARLAGVDQYCRDRFIDNDDRPTYLAPAIGLRQWRQIETDFVLTLADLVERRRFEDAVGLTGCHQDNHATDYEFESDEALFWVWVCRQWHAPLACELPYRILLPKGLENVLMACRAAGVSVDAHYSVRMQRDVQRMGEVAGLAAALAVRSAGGRTRSIDLREMREMLHRSGALRRRDEAENDDPFGPLTETRQLDPAPAGDDRLNQWVAEVRTGRPGSALWRLYRAGAQARPAVLDLLGAADPAITWQAAAMLAMWGDTQAEPRLVAAIVRLEDGCEAEPPERRPQAYRRVVPNWMTAISLLRRCGSAECLPALAELARRPGLPHNARTAMALSLEVLVRRGAIPPQKHSIVAAILDDLLEGDAPGSRGIPQKNLLVPREPEHNTAAPGTPFWVEEDWSWQLHLTVARARQAIGLLPHDAARAYESDPRAMVRRQFVELLGRV